MAGYRFEARDIGGRTRRGVLEVDNARHARALLRERGLWVVEVAALAREPRGSAASAARRSTRLPAAQLTLLMRQLAALVSARLTLSQALDALVEQAQTQGSRELLAVVRGEVLAGHTLAHALGRFPRAFPEMYLTLVAAGERSGQLAGVLNRLADYAEARQALRGKVGLALIYPLIVSAVAAAVIVVLLTHVVPEVVGVFRSQHQALPLLTRGLIAASAAVQAAGYYVLAAFVVAGFALRHALRQPMLRLRFDALVLRLPVIGALVRSAGAARFASTMTILVQSGVPVAAALRASVGVMTNRPMRRAVEQTAQAVGEGAALARALSRSGLFPPLLVHLAANGEASGDLGLMLERAATSEQRELEHRVALLTSLLEPLLILVMGGVVLLIVLATLLPIVELNQLVR